MKKRGLALFLALLVLVVCIVACDKNDAVDDDDRDDEASDSSSVKVTLVLVPANEEDRIVLGSALGDPISDALDRRLKNGGIDERSMMTSQEDNLIEVKFIAESKAQARDVADKLCPRGEVTLLFYEGNATETEADGSVTPRGTLILDSRNTVSAYAGYRDFGTNEPDPQPVITLAFDESGTAALAAATEKLAGKGTISMWLDYGENWAEGNQKARYQMVQTFDVFGPITEGEALLTGFEDMAEAEELADLIMVNLLPFDLKIKSIRFK